MLVFWYRFCPNCSTILVKELIFNNLHAIIFVITVTIIYKRWKICSELNFSIHKHLTKIWKIW